MDQSSFDEAVALIVAARQGTRVVEKLAPHHLPGDQNTANKLFGEVNRRLHLDIGGYKVGATSPGVLAQADALGPMPGTIPKSLIRQSPAVFSRDDFVCPVIEFELAFELGDDLPARASTYSVDEVLSATRTALVAIEVADPHFDTPFEQPISALYADNGAAGGLVIGPEIPNWRHRDLGQIALSARSDAGATVSGTETAARPDALWVLIWMANALPQAGLALKAGDYVSTGAIAAPVVLSSEREWRCEFTDIGEVCVSFQG